MPAQDIENTRLQLNNNVVSSHATDTDTHNNKQIITRKISVGSDVGTKNSQGKLKVGKWGYWGWSSCNGEVGVHFMTETPLGTYL